MRRKRKKKKNGKWFIFIIIVLIVIGFYYKNDFKNKIDIKNKVNITYYDIYGIHLNFKGNFKLDDNLSDPLFVLSNGKNEIKLNFNISKNNNNYTFYTSKYINDGINLEKLKKGNYYLLLKVKNNNKFKYISLKNKTKYKNLTYYTVTKNNSNNKIDIKWENDLLEFNIKQTKLPKNVYDITIDPGHDGKDSGMMVCKNGDAVINETCKNSTLYKESDINFDISKEVKKELEKLGYKVILTRNNKNENIDTYGDMGSATVANKVKSKFNFAIHNNSTNVPGGLSTSKGLEIYIANNTKLNFAKILVKNIKTYGNTNTSNKKEYKVSDGIYQRLINNVPYYYTTREIGGIATGAYVDGSNEKYGKNPYYNSNCTAEGYLLELSYIDNVQNLNNILSNTSGYAKGVALSIKEYLDN